jgi:hypothetical protein
LVTAHNGPQVTIHYKRAEFLACLAGVLQKKLDDRWKPPESEESYGARVAVEGASSQLQVHRPTLPQVGGGLRGRITGFSRQSRGRFMHQLAEINRKKYDAHQVLFLTLTYHKNWSQDPADQYADLRKWFKRMKRRWPGIVLQWRKEWQARLAPHFHLLVYTPREAIPQDGTSWTFVNDATEAWIEVARRPGDSEHHMFRYSVDACVVASWGGVLAYASKSAEYLSKSDAVQPLDEDGQPLPTGRLWGTLGDKKTLPVSFDVHQITKEDYLRFRRVFRRLARPKKRRWTRRAIPRGQLNNLRVLVGYGSMNRLLAAHGYYRK